MQACMVAQQIPNVCQSVYGVRNLQRFPHTIHKYLALPGS